jgi:hypothetical protein
LKPFGHTERAARCGGIANKRMPREAIGSIHHAAMVRPGDRPLATTADNIAVYLFLVGIAGLYPHLLR